MICAILVPIPASEPRCRPMTRNCTLKGKCLRYAAPLTPGSPLRDFTTGDIAADMYGGTVLCRGWLDSALAEPRPAEKRAVKPWIGESL